MFSEAFRAVTVSTSVVSYEGGSFADYVAEACAWEHDFLNGFYRYASLGNTAVCTHVFSHGTGELANLAQYRCCRPICGLS